MTGINSSIKKDQRNAAVAGVFFIVATVFAILGVLLYDPLLNHTNYLVLGASLVNRIVMGALCELILACSAVGTGIMLFPYLRKFNESWGLGYVCFRLLEVVFILIGIISVLSLLSLSQANTNATPGETATYHATGKMLQEMHRWTFMLGPNFMLGINTFIYSCIFYQSRLVPRMLSILGMVGALLIFTAALLEMFAVILQQSLWGVLLAIPVFAYEMILAVWLITKGFNQNDLLTKNGRD